MSLNMRPVKAQTATCLVLLLGCMFVARVEQAQFYSPALGHAFAWDYSDQSVREFNVVRFELRVDDGPPFSVGMPTALDGSQSYSTPLPVMSIGQHVLEVRACSSTTCGAWSEALHFAYSPPFVVEIQRRFGWPSPYYQP